MFNIWWSKVLILILGQLIEYYIEKILMEKFGCPNTNFGPLHWQGDSLAYSMLITALYLVWSKDHREPWFEVGSQSLAKYIIRVWTNNLWIWSWCNGLWLRRWIFNLWVSSSKPPGGSKVDSAFNPSMVNEMSTRYSWGLSGKKQPVFS